LVTYQNYTKMHGQENKIQCIFFVPYYANVTWCTVRSTECQIRLHVLGCTFWRLHQHGSNSLSQVLHPHYVFTTHLRHLAINLNVEDIFLLQNRLTLWTLQNQVSQYDKCTSIYPLNCIWFLCHILPVIAAISFCLQPQNNGMWLTD